APTALLKRSLECWTGGCRGKGMKGMGWGPCACPDCGAASALKREIEGRCNGNNDNVGTRFIASVGDLSPSPKGCIPHHGKHKALPLPVPSIITGPPQGKRKA